MQSLSMAGVLGTNEESFAMQEELRSNIKRHAVAGGSRSHIEHRHEGIDLYDGKSLAVFLGADSLAKPLGAVGSGVDT